jgi:hypothetical protein
VAARARKQEHCGACQVLTATNQSHTIRALVIASKITALKQSNLFCVIWLRGEARWLKRRDLIETMAQNIPSGAIRFSCHIAEIHPANPGNHGAVLTTLDGSIIRAKVYQHECFNFI